MTCFDRVMILGVMMALIGVQAYVEVKLEGEIDRIPPRLTKQFYLVTNDNCAMKIFEEGNKEPTDVD